MIIIVYSKTTDDNIQSRLGFPEYSYYFVLKEFLPVLHQLGIVIRVRDPAREVDPIYHSAVRHGESCVFLSFTPPHQTELDLDCPTIPVFAWEFDTIPQETWLGDRRADWRHVLRRVGRAITHSNFAVDTVRKAVGPNYPIAPIPAPVWDKYAAMAQQLRLRCDWGSIDFQVDGLVIDTRNIDIFEYSPQRIPLPRNGPWPHEVKDAPVSFQIPAGGIVYTSVFNPYDGRKNWFDLLSGFCWALRDKEDATLIMKVTHYDPRPVIGIMIENLYKLTPYKCRVLLVHGYFDDDSYDRLVAATTYVVNASHGEGQCLPLMEFMSCGKPAIAPANTSMADYVDDTNAFVVKSSIEPSFWPHDPRLAYRTFRHRINFETLVEAFAESYRVAKEAPQRYARMSERATAALEGHCSEEVVVEKLRAFLGIDGSTTGDAGLEAPVSSRPRKLVPLG